jgi:hypothetical protein
MALITDMGVTPGAGGIIMPMLKNKWKVEFFNIGGSRGQTGGATVQGDVLTLQAITGDRPKVSFEEIQLDRYNSRAWIAGKHMWEPVNFTFESDIGGRVARVFQEQLEKQQALISPSSGRVLNTAVSGQEYKFAMVVSMLDGDITPLEQWAYEGVWIQNIDYGDLDYAASEAVKLPVTFRYDHARQLILGQSGKATGGVAPFNPLR